MTADTTDHNDFPDGRASIRLRKLTVEQIRRIDEMLASMDEFGEVQLIVQHGELRFINRKTKHLVDGDSADEER